MTLKKTFARAAVAAATALLAAAPAFAVPTLIDFDGVTGYGAPIGDYYSSLGVSFTDAALALSNDELGPYFSHAPSAGSVMFASDTTATMNVTAGFTGELSFFYSAATSALDVVTIYSGLNGTGDVLGSISLSGNATLGGCSDSAFCNWQRISLSFAGTGQSVSFGGNPFNAAFDNVQINTVTAAVPEPATAAMLAFGMAGLMVAARRQRRGMSRSAHWAIAAVLLGGGVSASAAPLPCDVPEAPGDTRDATCLVKATGQPQRLRFTARFAGGHDDTSATLAATLDGQPLACEAGSKTRLFGEDGNVSLHCNIALTGKPGAEHRLEFAVRWSHAQYTDVQLDAE